MEENYIDVNLLAFKDIPVSLQEAEVYMSIEPSELMFIYLGHKEKINSKIEHLRTLRNLEKSEFDVARIELAMADISKYLHNYKKIVNLIKYQESLLNAEEEG